MLPKLRAKVALSSKLRATVLLNVDGLGKKTTVEVKT